MTQTNGHPTTPPLPTEKPAQVLSRRVFIEERTSDGLTEAFEPDEKTMNELGWVRWVTSADRTVVLGEGFPSESRERETEGSPVLRHLPPDEYIAVTATDLYRRIGQLQAVGYRSLRYPKRIGVLAGHDILKSEHGASIVFMGGDRQDQRETIHIAVALWAEFEELCRYEDKPAIETKKVPLRSRLTELYRERQEIDEKGGVQARFVTEAEFDALVDAVEERLSR